MTNHVATVFVALGSAITAAVRGGLGRVRRGPLVQVLVIALVAGLLAPVSPLVPAAPAAATPSLLPWVPNGQVISTAVDTNGTQYLAGAFTGFASATGGGALISTTTSAGDRTYPAVVGRVRAVVADGAGGWYIGGAFTSVGGVARNRLAHIKPDGTLDAWDPNPSSDVHSLAVVGDLLVVGGNFSTFGPTGSTTSRLRLAAFTLSSGQPTSIVPTSWNPRAYGIVSAIVATANTLYVGGSFGTFNGTYARGQLAAFDLVNGVPVSDIPNSWNPNASNSVAALAVTSNALVVGGSFTTIGQTGSTVTRNRLAAFTLTSGVAADTPNAWDPSSSGSVTALAASATAVYVGSGNVTYGSTYSRKQLAAFDIDPVSGAPSSTPNAWNPNAESSGTVNAIVVTASAVYVGGGFTSFRDVVTNGAVSRRYLAAFDVTGGVPSSTPNTWVPDASDGVDAMALSGTSVYVGGAFTWAGVTRRSYVAALDASGELLAWNPAGNQPAYAVVVANGKVHVGGAFATLGGMSRQGLASFDITAGVPSATPNAWNPKAAGIPRSFAVSETMLFVGGNVSSYIVDGVALSRGYIAAFDIVNGVTSSTPNAWNPGANNSVNALAVTGNALYAGGSFTTLTSGSTTTARNRLAAFDLVSGVPSGIPNAWNPNADGYVTSIAPSGSTVYVGGTFTSFTSGSAVTRNRLAAFDITAGVPSSTPNTWNPNANGDVNAIAVAGSAVYAGGSFTTLTSGSAVTRNRLAAFDITAGVPSSTPNAWDPNLTGSAVSALGIRGDAVCAGGTFSTSAVVANVANYQCFSGATANVPSLNAVSPATGPLAGGVSIGLSGQNFASGMTATVGGLACGSLVVKSMTYASCLVPGGAALGSVDVAITTANGSAMLTGAFTYVSSPAPTITAISPTSGPSSGGTVVTITGTSFAAPMVVNIGISACVSMTITSSTSATCTTSATLPAALAVESLVAVAGGVATLPSSFTFVTTPTVTTVAPSSGPTVGGTTITLTGTGYVSGMTVTVGGTACTSIAVASTTSASCSTPAGSAGAKNVVVTTIAGTVTKTNAFTYISGPTVTSISPTSGAPGTRLTLTGTQFLAGMTVTVDGAACTDVVLVSATSATCVVPSVSTGSAGIVVTTLLGTVTAASSFSVTTPVAPTVTAVSPTSGATAGGTIITLTGTSFLVSMTVTVGGAACTPVTVTSATSAKCPTPAGSAGAADVIATTVGGSGTKTGGFTYGAASAPTVSTVSPAIGATAGGTPITLTGTNFLVGMTVAVGGAACTSVTVTATTIATCATPAGTAGAADVVVTTAGGSATKASGFTYAAGAAPTLTSITPSLGPAGGGTVITLAGTGFAAGMTATVGGNACTSVTVTATTSATCTTASHAAGQVDVAVTTADGTVSLVNGFEYTGTAPTLSAISPTSGPPAGGTSVTLTGSGFVSGMTASIGGAACTSIAVGSVTSLTCTTPTGTSGAANVVVSTVGGSATLTGGFTYTGTPAPTLTAVSPTSGSTAGGTSITLTGTGFIAGMTVAVGSAACTTVAIASGTSASCSTPAGTAGTVAVIVTTVNGSATLANGFTFTGPSGTATVTFGANGGSGSMPAQTSSGPAVLDPNGFTPPPNSVFAGWNTAANGSGSSYAAGSVFPFGASTTLYAQWVSTASAGQVVTFDANGAVGPAVWQQSANPAALTSVVFAHPGLVFAGWNTAANGSGMVYADGATYAFTASVVLYAQWAGPSDAEAGTMPVPVFFSVLSLDGTCPDGWQGPSWQVWPNGGSGALTCNLFIPWSSRLNTFASDPAEALDKARVWEAERRLVAGSRRLLLSA